MGVGREERLFVKLCEVLENRYWRILNYDDMERIHRETIEVRRGLQSRSGFWRGTGSPRRGASRRPYWACERWIAAAR